MNNNLKLTDAELVKKIRFQMIVIGVLIAIILTGIFMFFFNKAKIIPKENTHRFTQATNDSSADVGKENFANVAKLTSIADSRGIFFDSSQIMEYLTKIYPDIRARHALQPGASAFPPAYKWKIGFYWAVKDSNGIKKLSFYVVPIIYDSVNNKVLDYFKSIYNAYYNHPINPSDSKNIYDEGHLWP